MFLKRLYMMSKLNSDGSVYWSYFLFRINRSLLFISHMFSTCAHTHIGENTQALRDIQKLAKEERSGLTCIGRLWMFQKQIFGVEKKKTPKRAEGTPLAAESRWLYFFLQ